MLFVLADSVIPACDGAFGPELDALQNLLLAVHRGVHALSGSHDIFTRLAKNSALAERERAVARRLANRRTELPILEQLIDYKVIVVGSAAEMVTDSTGCTYCIALRNLGDIPLSSSVVLAENAIDADLFLVSADHSRIHNRLTSLVVNGRPKGGGGSQISVELEHIVSERGIAAAITDGDIKYPGGPRSATSKRCDQIVNRREAFCWHRVICAHEIENIIPLEVYKNVIDPVVFEVAQQGLQRLNGLAERFGSNPASFVCFKSGKHFVDCLNSNDHAEFSYWKSVSVQLKGGVCDMSDCVMQELCLSTPCVCRISFGFGEKALVAIKKWVENRSHQKSLEQFKKSDEWMSIGKFVFDVTVAFRREAA